jgi:hypothetical protein
VAAASVLEAASALGTVPGLDAASNFDAGRVDDEPFEAQGFGPRTSDGDVVFPISGVCSRIH